MGMPDPAPAASRIVLVRHGETAWNAEGRWQGQTGVGLSVLGRQQAAVTAAHLVEAFGDAVLLARSDSERVAETAAPLEELLAIPVVVDERLREIDVGHWSGQTAEEVAIADPEGFAAYRAGLPSAIGGGETVEELRTRMLAAIGDVAEKAAGRTAIVVTHGWALRVAIAGLLKLSTDDAAAMERASNCSVTVVDVDVEADRTALVDYANCSHLELKQLVSIRRNDTRGR